MRWCIVATSAARHKLFPTRAGGGANGIRCHPAPCALFRKACSACSRASMSVISALRLKYVWWSALVLSVSVRAVCGGVPVGMHPHRAGRKTAREQWRMHFSIRAWQRNRGDSSPALVSQTNARRNWQRLSPHTHRMRKTQQHPVAARTRHHRGHSGCHVIVIPCP